MIIFILFFSIFFIGVGYRAWADGVIQNEYEKRVEKIRPKYETTPLSWQDPYEAHQNIHQYIYKNFAFYRAYSTEDQHEFTNRILDFISRKRIVGMDDFYMDDETKILVSIPAIRITFGLTDYHLPTLKTIGVYPSVFYNDFIRQEVKGITFATGVMYLSHEHLIQGNSTEVDHINLGLHEMAHAFKIFIEKVEDEAPVLLEELREFEEHAEEMMEMIRTGELTYFRKYAEVNSHEFFAISIENFFEDTQQFKETMPETYSMLSSMLNIKN
ncbi:MAG: zinc-dependent peptidase [Bacteroidetes bacterium]|nr:zinc-dependent peptidase [Bacteroidota bacterium]